MSITDEIKLTELRLKAEGIIETVFRLTGIRPSYSIEAGRVRIFLEGKNLADARAAIARIKYNERDVYFDFYPVIMPQAVRVVLPYAIGVFAAGFAVGRLSKR